MSSGALGKVYLVGAGPGDPKLLTLRAVEVLAECHVVLIDRLVNRDVLKHARRGAFVIDVGKRAGDHAMKQEDIGKLLVAYARQGQIVVRLKGGDPFVFGRGGEEALALARAQIPWEVVPGVAAGIAAAAYAGIPLTHRGVASRVSFRTARRAVPTFPFPILFISKNWNKISTNASGIQTYGRLQTLRIQAENEELRKKNIGEMQFFDRMY